MKPTVLNGRYRVLELVGAGGMATVYRGEDLLLERSVAVKFLREPYASDPEARERFLNEARSAAKLDHPSVAHVYDVGQDEGDHPYLVMELIAGEDLKVLIRREAPLPVVRALTIAGEICEGVGAAHRAGIVHCDLKPQNILLTETGQVKVVDFGIARALQQDDGDAETVEVVWGSPHYLSPEQAMGRKPTPASDVYSIGVMLYEMLTGVPPFHDPDPSALAMKHCREAPPPLTSLNPRVPSGLDILVRSILSKEPARRYRNADQLAMALDRYLRLGEEGTGPHPVLADEAPIAPTSTQRPQLSHQDGSQRGDVSPRVDAAEPAEGTQPVAQKGGFDSTLWMLIGVAAIAVVGLIPLWLFVYRAYTAPAPLRTPGPDVTPPAVTSTPERLVTVPNLRDLNAADAQRMVASLDLQLEVVGEEESSDVRPGAVLEQAPGVGMRVPVSSTISVILAAGRPLLMPAVVGYDHDVVISGLESDGLIVELVEIRSPERQGQIVDQVPDADVSVRAGDIATLTISGGANVPIILGTNLSDQVVLEQAWVSQFFYRPGDTVPVTLRWRCVAPMDASYKVFVHLLTQDGSALIAQRDFVPVNGLRPTTGWVAGEIISDPHQVPLPDGTPAGTYQIRVGLYGEGGRLSVVDAGEAQVLDDTIYVTDVTVQR